MAMTQCRVFGGQGELVRLQPGCEERASSTAVCVRTVADRVPITEIMAKSLVCARDDLAVDELVRLILRSHIGCVPIVDERGHPRGIVTKTDLMELLLTPERLGSSTAADVMMPLAIVLDERATVAHCASMMALEDFHHVMVVSCAGALIGVVSSQDVVRWLVANDSVPAD
jgi:CBS domain-containing protein